jgi:hypothetical protein
MTNTASAHENDATTIDTTEMVRINDDLSGTPATAEMINDIVADVLPSIENNDNFALTFSDVAPLAQIEEINGVAELPNIDDLLDDGFDSDEAMFAAIHGEWRLNMDTAPRSGEIKPTVNNVFQIMTNDPRFTRLIAHNEFTNTEQMCCDFDTRIAGFPKLELERGRMRPFDEAFFALLEGLLSAPQSIGGYGMSPDAKVIRSALKMAADKNKFNPLKDLFAQFEWDGVERLSTFWIDMLGAEDNLYHRETAIKWFVAGVMRMENPGTKFDHMVVFDGGQKGGQSKSLFVKKLGRGFHGNVSSFNIDSLEKWVEATKHLHVVEFAEMEAFTGHSSKRIKGLLTQDEDSVRLAYGNCTRTYYRGFIAAGTADKMDYLTDPNNNRRFWPILIGLKERQRIDIAKLDSIIDQVWAEAEHIYHEMLRTSAEPDGSLNLSLSPEAEEYAETLYSGRRTEDSADVMKNAIDQYILNTIQPGKRDPQLYHNFKHGGDHYSVESSFNLKSLYNNATGNPPDAYKGREVADMGEAASRTGYLTKTSKNLNRHGIRGLIHDLQFNSKDFQKLLEEAMNDAPF